MTKRIVQCLVNQMVEVSNKLLQLIKYYLCFVYYCLLSTTSCTFYEQENVKKKRTVQCLVNQMVEVSNKLLLIEYYLCLINLLFTLDKILSFYLFTQTAP